MKNNTDKLLNHLRESFFKECEIDAVSNVDLLTVSLQNKMHWNLVINIKKKKA